MCVVSSIGDEWGRTFPDRWPTIPTVPSTDTSPRIVISDPEVSKEDFDALRREVLELKKLLLAAKAYDEATGQPDCEMDEKVDLIRRVAEFVGVDVDEVFGSRFE
jgi:hypothetical protein